MGICYGKGGGQYEDGGEGVGDSGSRVRRAREGLESSPAAAAMSRRRRERGRSESRSAAVMRSRESSIGRGSPQNRASLPSPSPSWTWASPFRSPFRAQWDTSSSPANGTPRRLGPRKPFPPPSPAKHIQSALVRRRGGGGVGGGGSTHDAAVNVAVAADPPQFETNAPDNASHNAPPPPLRKYFGYAKNFSIKYEIGDEVGRGHFGHTCRALVKKGDLKGQTVAVKVISKDKMTTAIAIEDVKREVKILKALSGHPNLVKFYDVCEDTTSVYIVMELCEGGELLDRLLSRGGKYSEEEAKAVVVQILSVMSFCHFQGVVHRDLKPENFLFTSNEDTALLKAIDFGLSDFVRPDERLNDIVGSAYYVAPEVLHRSYSLEADMWSVGVITYILLSGSRPFWARTESGIFRSVLKSDPPFDVAPWPLISEEAKDFVKRLLTKDRHRRISAAQALTHPWLRGRHKVPLDILVFRLVKSYIRSSVIRRAALKALAKTLTEDQLFYLRAQFTMLGPAKNGKISLENFRSVLTKNATETMKASKMFDMIAPIDAAQSKKMDFHEFCAAATSVPQLEGLETWEAQARKAYQIFEKEGNRVVLIEDLARELGIPATIPAHVILHDWVRHNDGKLSFFGFTNLLRGMPPRTKHPQSTK